MEERIAQLERELAELKSLYFKENYEASQIFRKDITFIGRVGFFGTSPVSQQASIADPSGGITTDAEARTAINSILDVLDAYGLTA